MVLDLEELVLDGIVEESIRIVQTQADAQKIEVVTDVGKNLRMRGDRKALKQIMLNLLSNAVKFTPPGGHITVRARTTGTAVTFSVEDTGIGIPKEALKKLGRPFEQVGNQFTKSHRGSGLGLAITSSLAELHGGAMRIRSREGHGTIVSVRLPVDPTPPTLAPSDEIATEGPRIPRRPRLAAGRRQCRAERLERGEGFYRPIGGKCEVRRRCRSPRASLRHPGRPA